jgi:hypothetical protein
MKVFRATMRVTHVETWEVDAKNEKEAREKFNTLSEDVDTDDSGGETVDWEISDISESAEL